VGSRCILFIAQALVIFPSPLKPLRKGFLHCGRGILPLQFFQVAGHLGRDLIKFFAAVSRVQSRFEAQEVESLAVSELTARFEIVSQGCVQVRLVSVQHVLLTLRLALKECICISKLGAEEAQTLVQFQGFVLLVRANSTECEAAVVKIPTGCRNADPRPHVWTQADEGNRGLVDFVAKGMEKNATSASKTEAVA
jgi:hypothetical protein